MKETIKAYLAGIVDGEGSICVSYRGNRDTNKVYTVKVHIVNTDIRMVKFVKKHVGGYVRVKNDTWKNPKWKVAYRWILSDDTAIFFLDKIQKYLVCKKEHYRLVRKLRKTYWKRGKCGPGAVPDNIKWVRNEIYWKVRELNHKGKSQWCRKYKVKKREAKMDLKWEDNGIILKGYNKYDRYCKRVRYTIMRNIRNVKKYSLYRNEKEGLKVLKKDITILEGRLYAEKIYLRQRSKDG